MNKSKFSDIFEEYLVYSEKRHKKQGFDTSTRNFRLHILPYFKDMNIQDITKKDISNWQTIILSKNFSNSFNSSLYYDFSSFIKYCVSNSYLEENIVLLVNKFPKRIVANEKKTYNIWQFRRFRRHLTDIVYKTFFNFMFFCGTRPSEAMGLRFCDIEGLHVFIRHSIRRRGKRELDTPKNQSSVRDFYISLLMWFRIQKLKKHYIKEYGNFDNTYYVFGGKKPLASSTIDRRKKEACKNANLYEITQHAFRHSCATYLIHNKRLSIDEVSGILGHSKVSTTVDIYLHKEKRKPNFLLNFLTLKIKF